MADDAEAAFLRSMQVANEALVNYGAMDVASEQLPDSSSDEYDPAQAVQADSISPETNTISNNVLPTVTGVVQHSSDENTPQHLHTAHDQGPANISPPEILGADTQVPSTSIPSSPAVNVITPEALLKDEVSQANNKGQSRETSQPLSNGVLDSNGDTTDPASHSRSNASLKQLSTADVSIQNNVQDQPPAEQVPNGISQTVPNLAVLLPETGTSSHNAPATVPTETLPAPQITQIEPTSTPKTLPPVVAPRTRLPHDRIGILEDRIKEDPKGDLDAWLSLISEHRKRGKVNDARNVYERLLKVFPQAVGTYSTTLCKAGLLITVCRLNNGLPMHRWRTKREIEMRWRRSFREL